MSKFKTLLILFLVSSALFTKAQSQKESSSSKVDQQKVKETSDVSSFLKKNPSIANVGWKSDQVIVVHLKNGSTEIYSLDGVHQRQAFENKYGAAPIAPPPPPPALRKKG